MKKHVLLEIAIPKTTPKLGQLFYKFCVKEFGGKSKLFDVQHLEKEEVANLAKKFLDLKRKIFKENYSEYFFYLEDSVLGETYEKGIYVEIISKEKLSPAFKEKRIRFFLIKCLQLFDKLASGRREYERMWNREKAILEAEIKELSMILKPPINYSSIYE